MSQPNLDEQQGGEAVQKQQLSVYTMMLIVSFLAISIACLLLYLELKRWGSFPWWNTSGANATSYVIDHEFPEWQVPLTPLALKDRCA